MKAKEWVARFKAARADNDRNMMATPTCGLLREFVEEIEGIIRNRGGTPNAIEGAIREADQKFRAIISQAPDLGLEMFDLDNALVEHLDKKWYKTYEEHAARLYKRRLSQRLNQDYRAMVVAAEKETDPLVRVALRLCAYYEKKDRLAEALP